MNKFISIIFCLNAVLFTVYSQQNNNDSIFKNNVNILKQEKTVSSKSVNLFLIQGGADGLFSSSGDDANIKVKLTYSRRFWEETAFGVGYAYRRMYDQSLNIFFFDMRSLKKTRKNGFYSFGFDLGAAISNRKSFFSHTPLFINPSYTDGIRLSKNLYFIFGFDVNFQSNVYSNYGAHNSLTFGITAGVML